MGYYPMIMSASKKHIDWLRRQLARFLDIKGHITKDSKGSTYQLKYAKVESLKLLPKLYYDRTVVCLSRKRRKIERALKVAGKQL